MKKLFTLFILLITFSSLSFAQVPPDLGLIAHYKLDGTPDDDTGINGPIELTNAPYQEGGIYLNGIYIGDDPTNGSDASTPSLDSLDFSKFAIEVIFKITEAQTNPVIMGGKSFRWIGFYIFDSTVALLYNNDNYFSSQTVISYNTFHTALIVYDASTQTGKWYLDGNEVDSKTFTLNHGDDRTVTASNFATGNVFKGIIDDIKIYSLGGVTSVEDENISPEKFTLSQNYPNPFNPSTKISFAIGHSSFVNLKVYDVLGNEVATLVNEEKPAGTYEVEFNAADLTSGVYFYTLKAGSFIQTKKMIILK